MQTMTRLLGLTFLLMAGITSSLAQDNGALVDGLDAPMKSRTCGLVLLSDGRAKVRSNDLERAMTELVSAFALLQDGRLADKYAARIASQAILNSTPDYRATSIAECFKYFGYRKTRPDFEKSEAAMWDWVTQAQITAKTEKN